MSTISTISVISTTFTIVTISTIATIFTLNLIYLLYLSYLLYYHIYHNLPFLQSTTIHIQYQPNTYTISYHTLYPPHLCPRQPCLHWHTPVTGWQPSLCSSLQSHSWPQSSPYLPGRHSSSQCTPLVSLTCYGVMNRAFHNHREGLFLGLLLVVSDSCCCTCNPRDRRSPRGRGGTRPRRTRTPSGSRPRTGPRGTACRSRYLPCKYFLSQYILPTALAPPVQPGAQSHFPVVGSHSAPCSHRHSYKFLCISEIFFGCGNISEL